MTIDTVPLTVAPLLGALIVTAPDVGVDVAVGVAAVGVGVGVAVTVVGVGVGAFAVGVGVGAIGVRVGVAVTFGVGVGVEVLVPFSTSTVMLSEPTSVLLPLLLLSASMEIGCEPLATVVEFHVKLYGGLDTM